MGAGAGARRPATARGPPRPRHGRNATGPDPWAHGIAPDLPEPGYPAPDHGAWIAHPTGTRRAPGPRIGRLFTDRGTWWAGVRGPPRSNLRVSTKPSAVQAGTAAASAGCQTARMHSLTARIHSRRRPQTACCRPHRDPAWTESPAVHTRVSRRLRTASPCATRTSLVEPPTLSAEPSHLRRWRGRRYAPAGNGEPHRVEGATSASKEQAIAYSAERSRLWDRIPRASVPGPQPGLRAPSELSAGAERCARTRRHLACAPGRPVHDAP